MASTIQSYTDLLVWQKAFDLGLAIYRVTSRFPDTERYGLVSQLRRGGVSIESDIAEGYGRQSTLDYIRFLRMARGALYELQTQLLFAERLDYLPGEQSSELLEQSDECGRMLAGLIRSLEQKRSTHRSHHTHH